MTDPIVIAGFVIAVVALAIVLVLIPVIAYVIWRYVAAPWKVMRADIQALHAKISGLEQQARVKVMTDEEIARTEARLNARQRARMGSMSQ